MSLKENIKMMAGVLILALAFYLLSTFHITFGLIMLILSIIEIHKSVN